MTTIIYFAFGWFVSLGQKYILISELRQLHVYRSFFCRSWRYQVVNALTISRFVFGIILILCLVFDWNYLVLVLWLTGIAFGTDLFDGILAEYFNVQSVEGEILDKFADCFYSACLMIWLVFNPTPFTYPGWSLGVAVIVSILSGLVQKRKWKKYELLVRVRSLLYACLMGFTFLFMYLYVNWIRIGAIEATLLVVVATAIIYLKRKRILDLARYKLVKS